MTTPQNTALLLALVGIVTSVAACASVPERSEAPEGAILEVENRTTDDLALSVRGRTEAIVHSGTRLRVRHLLPGQVEASARATRGGPGAFAAHTTIALVSGETKHWSIVPDAAGGEPLPEVPGLGSLRVANPTKKDVSVLVNGVRVGRVFAGAERRFDDLPAGVTRVMARPDDGTAPTDAELMLVANEEIPWRFEQVGAELQVMNGTDEAIELTIDGEARGRIPAGETWTSREAPGLRVLQARSEPSRRPYEAVLDLTQSAPSSWKVEAGQSALVIENGTGEPLVLAVPGKQPRTLAPRGQARFDDLPTGPIELRARGETTQGAYAARLELMPSQVTTWVAGPVAGSIRIDNRTARVITVYTTIGGDEVERGRVQPNTTSLIRDLPRSNIHLSAIATGIARRSSTTIDLAETPAATWVVSGVSGAVRVANERDEAVDVFIDALRVGEVPAKGERTFTGAEVGGRLVECVGQTSGIAHADRLVVTEDVLVSLVVRDGTAWVVVDNKSGEAVATRGLLAEQVAEIPPGVAIRFRVRAGAQRLSVVGRDSGLVFARALEVQPGETGAWSVALEPGRLVLWSRLDETVSVSVDDRAQGTLPPDDVLTVGDLAPGRHRVQLVGLHTGIVRAEEVLSVPGGDVKVTFATETGVVLVENRSQERVEVTIDGALYGDAAGSAIHAFGRVPPGKREIELYFTTSHRTQRVWLELREGQRARVVAEAPMGVLVIDNSSRQPVRVTIDGMPLAVVPADAGPTLVNAPSGGRHVRIERMGDRTELGFKLQIRADSAIHVPVPPRTMRLVVVNRSDVALTLFAGEHRFATIAARSSEMFDELPDGEQRLFAKDAEGHITHEERRRLHAGETATWVLATP